MSAKYFCDCCGALVKTWYTVSFIAHCEGDKTGRGTLESLSNNMQQVLAPESIYCKECVDRAKATLKPQEVKQNADNVD